MDDTWSNFSFIEIDNSINSCLRSVLSLMFYEDINENGLINYMKESRIYIQSNIKISVFWKTIYKVFILQIKTLYYLKHHLTVFIKGVEVRLEDREVSSWNQPIIVEKGKLFYVLVNKSGK